MLMAAGSVGTDNLLLAIFTTTPNVDIIQFFLNLASMSSYLWSLLPSETYFHISEKETIVAMCRIAML